MAGIPAPNGITEVVAASPSNSLSTKRSTDSLTPAAKRQRPQATPPTLRLLKPQLSTDGIGSAELASQSDSQMSVEQPVSPSPSATTQYSTAVPVPARSGNPARWVI